MSGIGGWRSASSDAIPLIAALSLEEVARLRDLNFPTCLWRLIEKTGLVVSSVCVNLSVACQ
jgi:hypothetical protein